MKNKNVAYALCVFLCIILFALFSTSQGVCALLLAMIVQGALLRRKIHRLEEDRL